MLLLITKPSDREKVVKAMLKSKFSVDSQLPVPYLAFQHGWLRIGCNMDSKMNTVFDLGFIVELFYPLFLESKVGIIMYL